MCWMYFLYAKFLSVVVCYQMKAGCSSEELVHTLNIQHSYEIPSACSSALEQLYPDLIEKQVTRMVKTVKYCVKFNKAKMPHLHSYEMLKGNDVMSYLNLFARRCYPWQFIDQCRI